MNNASYVLMSRQAGLSKELNGIANNIANTDTAGFRSEHHLFSEYIKRLGPTENSVSQTNSAGRFFNTRPGALSQTGNVLDVAIEGQGYFVVETSGGERLTRAGAFVLDNEGQIMTHDGNLVLGEGGTPLTIPPEAETVVVAPDGSISTDGAPIGKLNIVSAAPQSLTREGANLLKSTKPFEAIENPRVRQGFVEDSNVNAVAELSRLIEVQRNYERNQQLLRNEDERILKTIEGARPR